jgi:hypothetical protein
VNGKPLADHASESGVGSIAELFSSAKPRDRQLDLGG